MSTLPMMDPSTAVGPAADLMAGAQRDYGIVPNMHKTMANSPALLSGYMSLSKALGDGVLSPQVRESITLTVSQSNGCGHCLSAHSFLAEKVAHLSADDIAKARQGHARDPKTAALLSFAATVNDTRGKVTEDDFDDVRAAGATDEEIAETIGNVALTVFTNYFNIACDVPLDPIFPTVDL